MGKIKKDWGSNDLDKTITKKQAMYLLLTCLVGTKFQRLPSFLADIAGKSFWVVLCLYILIDGIFLILSLKIINLGSGKRLYEVLENKTGKIFAKIIFVMLGVYFIMLAVLPYESVHEVFADIIFDSLPWKFFALFLLIAMGVIAVSGLKNIGRTCQLFFFLIMIGIFGLFALGVSTTDLTSILPITETIPSTILEGFYKSTLWFGNFTILYVLMGRIKDQEDGKFNGIKLSFFLSSLFVIFAFITYYGIYQEVTPLKRNWLTKVSQFALLSLDIGRLDWFLILFGELATIITAGVFVYCSAYCFQEVFQTKKINYIIYIILGILYLNTNFLVKGKLVIFRFIISIGAIYGMIIQYVLPIILLIIAHKYNRSINPKKIGKFVKSQKIVEGVYEVN